MGAGIVVEIGADVKNAITGINKVNKALGDKMTGPEKFRAAVDRAFVPAIAVVGAVGTAAVLAAKKASDLAETQSKVGEIFGDASKSLQQWSLDAPTALGQTQQAALDAASTMATFGKAAGLTGDELVAFSTDTVNLSADLASFYNTDPSEVVSALGAALRGESEPMRKYGVLLDAATLEARAMAMGIYDGTGALTAQQKVLAAQAEIMAQTGDAQGDFARTADGAANQQRIFTAQMEQFQTEMGSALLPVFTQVTKMMATFAGWARENQGLVMALVGVITGLAVAVIAVKVGMTLWAAAQAIATAAQWAFNAALLANPLTWIVVAIIAVIAAVVLLYNKVDWFRDFIDTAWAAIKTAIEVVVDWFKDTAWPIVKQIIDFMVGYYKMLWKIVKWAWDLIWGIIEKVIKWIRDTGWPIVQQVIDFMVGYWKFLWESVKGFWDLIWGIIEKVVVWIRDTAATIIDGAVNVISGIWNGLQRLVERVWSAIKTAINGPAKWIRDTIVPLIRGAIDSVTGIFEGLRDAINTIFERIKTIVSGSWQFVIDKLNSIKGALSNIPLVGGLFGGGTQAQVIPFGARSAGVLPMSAARTVGGGGSITSPTVIVNGALDPVAVAKQIRRILDSETQRMGSVA